MYQMVIADDDFATRKGLASIIDWKRLGFEVVESFEDGWDVIEYMKEHSIDVVFTDVEMYEVSGLEVARWMLENRPDVIAVIVSGYREFDYVKEALSANVFDYILKPLKPEEIENTFRKIRKKLDVEKNKEVDMKLREPEEELLLLPERERAIERAKEYIEKHMNGELSVEKVADSVCMSRSHFAREFKQVTGDSVMDYVIKRRMTRAEALLRKGETSQKKIALMVGYSDLKYFQRSFKKYTGYTVKEYQRLLRC